VDAGPGDDRRSGADGRADFSHGLQTFLKPRLANANCVALTNGRINDYSRRGAIYRPAPPGVSVDGGVDDPRNIGLAKRLPNYVELTDWNDYRRHGPRQSVDDLAGLGDRCRFDSGEHRQS
jgi:hypothetical protein